MSCDYFLTPFKGRSALLETTHEPSSLAEALGSRRLEFSCLGVLDFRIRVSDLGSHVPLKVFPQARSKHPTLPGYSEVSVIAFLYTSHSTMVPTSQSHFFPKASAKGSSSNCVAHTTQHNTTQHHTTARHTPARPTTAPHTTARHTPQQDATPPDRLMLYSYYILNYFLAGGRIGAT